MRRVSIAGGDFLKQDIFDLLEIGENHELECKLADGGLPESLWETYSSFANTEGGTILLGIKEHRETFTVYGLDDRRLAKYQKEFWSIINNRGKISKNILLNHHISVIDIQDKKILRINIPAADRHDKPVYIGTNPMAGAYRRNYEGDYLCSEEEVRSMFADQQDASYDMNIVEEMGLDAFNFDTIKGYRIRFESLSQTHPWNRLPNDEFLLKLTAVKKNKNGELSPTIAGLLMFGEADKIVQVFPSYFLDYREESDDKGVRWHFRTTSDDGDWSGNLYDFFYKVINRVDDDIAVPFANRRGNERIDKVEVHEALYEIVANALLHANYYGRQGIVIIKNKKKILISNPGTLRITREELLAGGTSDPRNPILFKLFHRVNVGERAGSGVDKVISAWKDQGWKEPEFKISYQPERVKVNLEVGQVVYIREVVDLRVREKNSYGDVQCKIDTGVTKKEKVLAYIVQNGSIAKKEVVELCGYKSKTSAQKLIKNLVEDNIIKRIGNGPATKYVLSSRK